MAEVSPENATSRTIPLANWIEQQGLDWERFAMALLEGEAPVVHRCAGRYFVRPVSHHLWCLGRRVRGQNAVVPVSECERAGG